MRRSLVLGLFASALSLVNCGSADGDVGEAESAATGDTDVFSEIAPLGEITITAPFSTLFAPDTADNPLHGRKAEASVTSPALRITSPMAAKLKVRGNTSLIEDECTFPKLKLEFKDSTTRARTPFAKAKQFKIATHCGERTVDDRTPYGRVANEVAPWREAFTYQLVRAAGAAAPRSRPVTIRYVDPVAKTTTVRKAALIEDVGDLAARVKGKEVFVVDSDVTAEDPRAADAASVEKMSVDEVARVHLIEAMIGNDDWRLLLKTERQWYTKDSPSVVSPFWNMEAVRLDAGGRELPVPVDFDLARTVAPVSGPGFPADAFYGEDAASQAQFSTLMAARQRLPRAALDAARTELLGKRAALLARTDAPWLDAPARANAKKMVTFFFDLLADDARLFAPVVSEDGIEHVKADGTPDDACFSWPVDPGTPIHRWGIFDEAHGTEQVSLLDPRLQIPCNDARVWVKRTVKTTTDFPKR